MPWNVSQTGEVRKGKKPVEHQNPFAEIMRLVPPSPAAKPSLHHGAYPLDTDAKSFLTSLLSWHLVKRKATTMGVIVNPQHSV